NGILQASSTPMTPGISNNQAEALIALLEALSRWQAMRSAMDGKIGKIYEGSFESEMLKKQKMNKDQISSIFFGWKPAAALRSWAPFHKPWKKTPSQGIIPSSKIGKK